MRARRNMWIGRMRVLSLGRAAAALVAVVGCTAAAGADPLSGAPEAGNTVTSVPAVIVSPRLLTEVTDIAGVAISPDGSTVAFRTETASIERNTYDSSWYAVDIDRPGVPVRIADGGIALRDAGGFPVAVLPQWSADSRWIYYQALFDGEVQVWRAARDGSRSEQVTRGPANVKDFQLVGTNRHQTLVYRTGATREAIEQAELDEYDQGIRFDNTINAGKNLFRSVPIEGRLTSPRTLRAVPLLWNAPDSYHAVDTTTLATADASDTQIDDFRRLTRSPESLGSEVRAFARSPDGKRMAILTGNYPESGLHVRSGKRNASTVGCETCRSLIIEAVAWRNDNELVFTVRSASKDFAQSLYAWRVDDGKARLVAASDGLLGADRYGEGSTCAVGRRHAACVTASAAVAPRLERIDLGSGERTVLADPNRNLNALTAKTITVEAVSWIDAAGHVFNGHLFLPLHHTRNPRLALFITYYRCPGFLRGGFGDEWPLSTLAGSGIATLCLTRPLLPRIRNQQAAEDYAVALEGISEIVDRLAARGVVDKARVGMGGFSYGGEVAAWVGGKSNLLSAISVATTQTSPAWYWFSAPIEGRADAIKQRWGLGRPDETPRQWEKVSPPYFADRFKVPFLMQIPEGEYRASLELHERMLGLGNPTELWVYPDETHMKYRPRVKLAVYERNLDWFRFWLLGEEDPSTAKAGQYARWRSMRDRASP